MLTLSLWKNVNSNHDSFLFGKKLGDGADGEVFELSNDPDKVIKISAIFEDYSLAPFNSVDDKYLSIANTLDFLLENKVPYYATLFNHSKIGTHQRPYFSNNCGTQEYLLYYYIMEKCYKLTEDEKKLFHTLLSHEDRGVIKKFTDIKFKEILFGLSRGLDFDEQKVIFFYESIQSSKIIHDDLHPRNIMKNKFGDFKLIDFDRLHLEEL